MTRLDDLKQQSANAITDPDVCPLCNDTGYMSGVDGASPCTGCEAGWREKLRLSAMQRWEDMCPRRFASYTLDTHPNQPAADAIRAWLDDGVSDGRNLFLAGTVGSGKTGIAVAALRELVITHRRNVRHGSVAGLLEGMRPKSAGDAPGTVGLDDLQRVHVLLLDDLGVEKASEWQAERLYLIVNDRYERQLPTIMTTNMNRKDLEARVGERIMSRLMEDVQVVQMGGDDLRKRGA